MPIAEEEITRPRLPDPPEGALEVLKAIADDDITVSFQGLKRRMKTHQESLSRALQRLEDEGLVHRSRKGYSLTENGQMVASQWLAAPLPLTTIIMQSYMPEEFSPEMVAERLEGRWFSNLRWLGFKEETDRVTLKWITERNGIEIAFRIRPCHITVTSNAHGSKDLSEAFFAAQRIIGFLQRAPEGGRRGLACDVPPFRPHAS